MSFVKTSSSPRGRVYQTVIRRYRRRRRTQRPDQPGVWEDPAPDWVWQLAEGILEHTSREPDSGRRWLEEALAWCEACPAPALRSARLLAVVQASVGAPLPRLRAFLDRAWKDSPSVA